MCLWQNRFYGIISPSPQHAVIPLHANLPARINAAVSADGFAAMSRPFAIGMCLKSYSSLTEGSHSDVVFHESDISRTPRNDGSHGEHGHHVPGAFLPPPPLDFATTEQDET